MSLGGIFGAVCVFSSGGIVQAARLLLYVLLLSPLAAVAEDPIYDRANSVIAKLEVLDNLGRSCDYLLSVKGMEGAQSESCSKYLTNMRGPYFESIGNECVKLSNWYEQKQKFIASNKSYPDLNPNGAKRLLRDMKAVTKACHPDSLESYEYLTKPLKKINALGSLK
jgi:hypothetical protein